MMNCMLEKLTMDKVPCVNCITLSMCKAKLDGGCMMDLMKIAKECSLLKEYVYPENEEGRSIGEIQLVLDVENILATNITYNPSPF